MLCLNEIIVNSHLGGATQSCQQGNVLADSLYEEYNLMVDAAKTEAKYDHILPAHSGRHVGVSPL